MKFAYREYLGELSGTSDFRLIVRPVITVRVCGTSLGTNWDALVDTGADETLLPLSLAELLEVPLETIATQAAGISGEKLLVFHGDLELQISAQGETIAWRTSVGFVEFGSSDEEVIILGHGGCLDYFTATFDGANSELELTANDHLPRIYDRCQSDACVCGKDHLPTPASSSSRSSSCN